MSSEIMNNTPTSTSVKGRSTPRVSAYAFFQKDTVVRENVKKSLGDNPSFGEISKGMSVAWKALTDVERAKYQTKVEDVKAQLPDSPSKKVVEPKKPVTQTKPTKPTKSTKRVQKRARSAYTLYTMAIKESVATENPGASFGDLSKLMGGKWKTLSSEEKQPYVEANEKEKLEMEQAKSSQVAPNPTISARKRARSAYALYSSDSSVREAIGLANPTASFGDRSKLISAQWKGLSETDRQPYVEASNKEKSEFAEAKQEAGELTSTSGKERKRARSAYALYTMDQKVKDAIKVKHPDVEFTTFSKIISAQWKEMSDDEKAPYVEASNKEKEEMAAKKVIVSQNEEKKPKQKRARSAYTLYSSDPLVRDVVVKANPDADFGVLSKLISAQWKDLSGGDKQKYVDASQKQKDAMAAEKEASKPQKTRAKSAYLHYSMDAKIRDVAKKENPGFSVTDLAQVLGAQWKQLSEEARKPYNEAYQAEKATLQKETTD